MSDQDRIATERLRAVVDSAYDAILTVDAHHIIRFMNAAAERMFGYDSREVVGQNLNMLLPERFSHRHSDYTHSFARSPTHSREMRQRSAVFGKRRNGEEFRAEVTIAKIMMHDQFEMVAIIRDVNDTAHLLAELQQRATTDFLTGIANRFAFMQAFEAEFARSKRYARPLSVFLVDVDHFKKVNDSYGHATGDRLLKAITSNIAASLRATDTFARYGGEEFVAMLPETSAEAALAAAERARKAGAACIELEPGKAIRATVSIGLASVSVECVKAEALLAQADAALYEAKRTGRDRVVAAS